GQQTDEPCEKTDADAAQRRGAKATILLEETGADAQVELVLLAGGDQGGDGGGIMLAVGIELDDIVIARFFLREKVAGLDGDADATVERQVDYVDWHDAGPSRVKGEGAGG